LWSGIDYPDWEVTTLFYAAVHLVDAYLATLKQHPTAHTSRSGRNARNDMVYRYLPSIAVEYIQLFQLSKAARYGYSKQMIVPDDVDDAEDWFKAVAAAVTPLI
jgi:hypothetical protein